MQTKYKQHHLLDKEATAPCIRKQDMSWLLHGLSC